MQIGAEGVLVHSPLGAVNAVIAVPPDKGGKGLTSRSQIGAPPVVLKSHQGVAVAGRNQIPDAAGSARPGMHGPGVEDTQARQFIPLRGPVVVPDKLIAAADRQQDGPVIHGSPDPVAFGAG